nr:hypothetical protein BaRGS_008825 [Batillaria attramentaria]
MRAKYVLDNNFLDPSQDCVFRTVSCPPDASKNGEAKSSSLHANTPPPDRKSRFHAFGKIFKPWKWKRKKKSDRIEKTVVVRDYY